ncbi:hypothetical protein V1258_12185 [Brachybacterium sp. J153]|nr:hypothetical protein [Brachybacterium sp. J153]MEE1619177.1 hypothetical protein [Brachybacterium sp. J153]
MPDGAAQAEQGERAGEGPGTAEHERDQARRVLPPRAQQQRRVPLGPGLDRALPEPGAGRLPHRVLHGLELGVGELHVLPGVGAEEAVLGIEGEDHRFVGPDVPGVGDEGGVLEPGVLEHGVVQGEVVGGIEAVVRHVHDQHDEPHVGAEVGALESRLEPLLVQDARDVANVHLRRRLGVGSGAGERAAESQHREHAEQHQQERRRGPDSGHGLVPVGPCGGGGRGRAAGIVEGEHGPDLRDFPGGPPPTCVDPGRVDRPVGRMGLDGPAEARRDQVMIAPSSALQGPCAHGPV